MDHYVDNSGSRIRNLGSILDELSTEVQNCRDSLNQTLPVHEDSWDIVRMVQPIEIALSQASIMFTHRHGTSRKTAGKIEDLNKKIIAFSERFDLPQLDDSIALLWEIHRELLERNNQLLLEEDKPFMCYCEEECDYPTWYGDDHRRGTCYGHHILSAARIWDAGYSAPELRLLLWKALRAQFGLEATISLSTAVADIKATQLSEAVSEFYRKNQ